MRGKAELEIALAVLLTILVGSDSTAKIIYVDSRATSTNNGSSWVNAYKYLQDALADANSSSKPVDISVAQGTYKPDQGAGQKPGDRTATFQLINGVTLKGGYAGFGAPDPNTYNVALNKTILSGDLGGNDIGLEDFQWQTVFNFLAHPSRSENSSTVVTANGTDSTAILDGFTITAGHANTCDTEPNNYNEDPNSPQNNGAGMYIHAGSPTLTNCTFHRNTAQVTECSGAGGGGIFAYNSNPTLRNCSFIENIVFGGNWSSHGGGMYNINSNPILSSCLFKGNIAMGYDSEYYGGAICNSKSNPKLTDCTFIDNLADWGGAMANDPNSFVTATGCVFKNNHANDAGGAISSTANDLNLVNCTFEDNTTKSYGGGISCSGYINLFNCAFTRNNALTGGGICTWFGTKATLNNCTFKDNTANDGGGIYNGGAWLNDPNGRMILTGCTFSSNSAYWGGAMYNAWNTNSTVINCLFAGNYANTTGGGIYYCGCEQRLTNCTFLGNSAQSGNALAFQACGPTQPSRLQAINCIIWNNTSSVFNSDGSTVDIIYSNVQGGWPGEGNINEDPFFADPNGVDFHLKSQAGRWNPAIKSWVKDDVTSTCIDAGNPMSPIGLEPFPNGGRINMGAYGGTAEASKSYFGEPVCETIVASDINGDCKTDWQDLVIIASHWLQDAK
jgi:predicted outer membrane repeat protein